MIDNENRFSILNQIFEGHLFDFTISFNFWGHMVSSSRKTLPQFSERNPLTASATDHQRFSTPVSSRNSRENKIQLLKKTLQTIYRKIYIQKKYWFGNVGLDQANKQKETIGQIVGSTFLLKQIKKTKSSKYSEKIKKKKSRQTDINLKRNLHQPRYINQATGENSR